MTRMLVSFAVALVFVACAESRDRSPIADTDAAVAECLVLVQATDGAADCQARPPCSEELSELHCAVSVERCLGDGFEQCLVRAEDGERVDAW